jgi:uncharacterized protein (TIGR03000 family)
LLSHRPKGWLTMFTDSLFLAAVCSLGMLAMNPLVTEAAGGSGHSGGGHGGGGHGGGHSGGGSVHVAHAGVAHVSGAHVQVAHVSGAHVASGARSLNYRAAYYNHAGRGFDQRRFFYGGFYYGYPFGYGYGYGGYPYYDNYYNSYYNAPTYVAPSYDYGDPGYSPFAGPAYDYAPPAANSYAPPANDYADPLQGPTLLPAPLNDTAEVTVFLPQPDAQIWVNGKSMPSNSSTRRSFVSPPLQPGRPYSYRISAAWMENGRQVRVDKMVSLTAGRGATVDFTSARTLPRADD